MAMAMAVAVAVAMAVATDNISNKTLPTRVSWGLFIYYFMEKFLIKYNLIVNSIFNTLKLLLYVFIIYFTYNTYHSFIKEIKLFKNSISLEFKGIKDLYQQNIENQKVIFEKQYNTLDKKIELIEKQTGVPIDATKLITNILFDFITPKAFRVFKR